VVKAEVQSAITLSEQKVEEIKKALESKIKKTIKIEAKVFPKIIGGLIIYIGSSIIDRSIMGRLKVMREKLLAMEGM
jgi:F-type H+-transporting ATPase subunit delta